MTNPIKPQPKNTKEPKRNWMVSHHIQQNKAVKTNVKGAMGFIRRITLIHHKPQPLTLTSTNHVHIAMHMGMIMIITSHFTQSYDMANHITPLLARVRVLKRVQKGKVIWLTKIDHQVLVQGQLNIMQVRFAWLEVLVAHMATQVKSNAFE